MARKHLMSLSGDAIKYGLFEGLARSSGLLLLPLLTRAFSPAEYGAIDIVAVVTAVAMFLIGLGLPNAAMRYLAVDDDRTYVDRATTLLAATFAASLAVVAAVSLFAGDLSGLLLGDRGDAPFIRLGAIAAAGAAVANLPVFLLRAQRRVAMASGLALTRTLLHVGLAVIAVAAGWGLTGIFVAVAASHWAGALAGLAATRTFYGGRFRAALLRQSLAYSLPLIPGTLMGIANQQTDRVVVLSYLGVADVGVYGAAARVALVAAMATLAFRMAWTPYALGLADRERSERDPFYRAALTHFATGFGFLSLCIAAFGREILAVVAPPSYAGAAGAIPWLVGSHILHGAASITAIGILLQGRTGISAMAAPVGAAANVAITLALVPALGLRGAAVGTFVAELVLAVILFAATRRIYGRVFDGRRALLALATFAVGATLAEAAAGAGSAALSLGLRTAVLLGGGLALAAVSGLPSAVLRAARARHPGTGNRKP